MPSMPRTRLQKLKEEQGENGENDENTQDGNSHENTQHEVSLDQLFKDLAAETAAASGTKSKSDPDSLDKIKQDLNSLPKIESKLDTLEENKKPKSGLIVKVNDPVTHKVVKPKKGQETDSGSKWFNMKTQELTPEIKRDLLILKNRSVLDPKRHYKKDNWEIPKFFQMGTIVEGNTEFYSSRMSKKSRGRTIAEQILKDDKSTEYFDKKYTELQKAKNSGGKAHYQKLMHKRRGF